MQDSSCQISFQFGGVFLSFILLFSQSGYLKTVMHLVVNYLRFSDFLCFNSFPLFTYKIPL